MATDARNPFSEHLDTLPASAIVRLMNAEDRVAVDAVLAQAEAIGRAIEIIAERLAAGGRLFYVGAGSSGRLGVLDAAECPPTFGVPPDRVIGIIAGGERALREAIEGAEDRADLGADDLIAHGLSAADVVVAISASGRTPYVIGAAGCASARGAVAIGLTCSPDAPLASLVDVSIVPDVGPEVLTGSTRLKAGTATKMVLNMLSTGAMVRLGHTYGNLMVDVQPTNAKLVARAQSIVAELTGLAPDAAAAALERAGGDIKTAVVSVRLDLPPDDARALVLREDGRLRAALQRGRLDRAGDGPLFVGVDGGATKTVAWLSRDGASVVGRGLAGPGNPRSVGFAAAERHIDMAIAAAFADAGLPRTTCAAAGFALAGVGRADERAEIEAWAGRAGIARHVVVTDDAESVLAAGAPEGWGIALVCGTGTLAVGRNDAGATARAGGWGYLLGDEGGAYAIAVAGLRAAMRGADGLAAPTSLTGALLARIGARAPADLVAYVYGPDMSREQIALLATVVFDEAASDDTARAIIADAARSVASLIATLVERLALEPGGYVLAVTGSVITHQAAFRALVIETLAAAGRQPRLVRVVAEPVAGAIVLARACVGRGDA